MREYSINLGHGDALVVIFEGDGDKTSATLGHHVQGRLIAMYVGFAYRNPTDDRDDKVGKAVALYHATCSVSWIVELLLLDPELSGYYLSGLRSLEH